MATTARTQIALREMTRADLSRVRRIEQTAYADAWPRTTFEAELRNQLAQYVVAIERPESVSDHDTTPAIGPLPWLKRLLRLEPSGDPIVGFFGVWFTVDQLHLVTLAVAPDHQRRGIAPRLLLECFSLALSAELRSIALEVRPSNERAIALYEHFGFAQVGRLPSYYANDDEDALVMLTGDFEPAELRAHIERLRATHEERYGETFA
jgi:ribosomal-protein-alanine N-acetyltransferase